VLGGDDDSVRRSEVKMAYRGPARTPAAPERSGPGIGSAFLGH
jgi:hypothetical protein